MAQPAYPSLEPEGGKIGFEGLAPEGDQRTAAGSFSVQFTPSAGDKQQLTDETQPSYKTFEAGGEQPTHASSEEINLLEKGATQSDAEKVTCMYSLNGRCMSYHACNPVGVKRTDAWCGISWGGFIRLLYRFAHWKCMYSSSFARLLQTVCSQYSKLPCLPRV